MKKIKNIILTILWAISLPFVWLFALERLWSVKRKYRKYKKHPEDFLDVERYGNVYFLTRLAKYLFRIKISKIIDHQKLVCRPQIIVCNHRSILDSVLLYNLCYDQLGTNYVFVAKKELKESKLGFILDYIGSIFIDRDNIRDAIKLIDTQKELIKNGKTIIVFPEGTRNNGDSLLEFKSGVFETAYRAMCPIQPLVITHTNEYYENKKEFRGKKQPIELSIMNDFKPHNFISIDRVNFSRNIQKIMQSKYNEMAKVNGEVKLSYTASTKYQKKSKKNVKKHENSSKKSQKKLKTKSN